LNSRIEYLPPSDGNSEKRKISLDLEIPFNAQTSKSEDRISEGCTAEFYSSQDQPSFCEESLECTYSFQLREEDKKAQLITVPALISTQQPMFASLDLYG
jgi:hypothetical protein